MLPPVQVFFHHLVRYLLQLIPNGLGLELHGGSLAFFRGLLENHVQHLVGLVLEGLFSVQLGN